MPDIKWIAGFVDGEAHIGVHYNGGFCPRLAVYQSSKDILHAIREVFSAGTVIPQGSDGFSWVIHKQKLLKRVLTILIPHLIVKRAQAELLLEFVTSRLRRRRYGWSPHNTRELEIVLELANHINPKRNNGKPTVAVQMARKRLAEISHNQKFIKESTDNKTDRIRIQNRLGAKVI